MLTHCTASFITTRALLLSNAVVDHPLKIKHWWAWHNLIDPIDHGAQLEVNQISRAGREFYDWNSNSAESRAAPGLRCVEQISTTMYWTVFHVFMAYRGIPCAAPYIRTSDRHQWICNFFAARVTMRQCYFEPLRTGAAGTSPGPPTMAQRLRFPSSRGLCNKTRNLLFIHVSLKTTALFEILPHYRGNVARNRAPRSSSTVFPGIVLSFKIAGGVFDLLTPPIVVLGLTVQTRVLYNKHTHNI